MKQILLIFLFLIYSCESLIYSEYKIIRSISNKSDLYKVKKGDNLYSISKKLNISIGSLIRLNSIKPPYKIYPNQKILLPKQSFHKVRKGETLYSISRLYNTDVYSISRLNDLKNINSINEGQILKIYKDKKAKVKNITSQKVSTSRIKKIS